MNKLHQARIREQEAARRCKEEEEEQKAGGTGVDKEDVKVAVDATVEATVVSDGGVCYNFIRIALSVVVEWITSRAGEWEGDVANRVREKWGMGSGPRVCGCFFSLKPLAYTTTICRAWWARRSRRR
jgi:hypothetical protein